MGMKGKLSEIVILLSATLLVGILFQERHKIHTIPEKCTKMEDFWSEDIAKSLDLS